MNKRLVSFSLILALLAGGATAARAQAVRPIITDVGIDQKLNAQVPGDLVFTDENGVRVRLDQYYGKRPFILALVYYECPMLCTMVLNDLKKTLVPMKMSVGEHFDILTVSFDPTEGPELASRKKDQYIRAYGQPKAEEGWHFLTGDEASIKTLTEAVGFRYAWDEKFKQYAHASGIMVLTPDGKVSKYFYGVEYSSNDLRLALTEASDGKIGGVSEQVLLYCLTYDPATGKYSLAITRLMRVAAALTLVCLGTFWFVMYRRRNAPVS